MEDCRIDEEKEEVKVSLVIILQLAEKCKDLEEFKKALRDIISEIE